MDKPIRLSAHAKLQLRFRGTNEGEVTDVIRTQPSQPAEQGRLECRKDFPYNTDWNGNHYGSKQVRLIFAD